MAGAQHDCGPRMLSASEINNRLSAANARVKAREADLFLLASVLTDFEKGKQCNIPVDAKALVGRVMATEERRTQIRTGMLEIIKELATKYPLMVKLSGSELVSNVDTQAWKMSIPLTSAMSSTQVLADLRRRLVVTLGSLGYSSISLPTLKVTFETSDGEEHVTVRMITTKSLLSPAAAHVWFTIWDATVSDPFVQTVPEEADVLAQWQIIRDALIGLKLISV